MTEVLREGVSATLILPTTKPTMTAFWLKLAFRDEKSATATQPIIRLKLCQEI